MSKTGAQFAQPVERRVGAVALVAIGDAFFLADLLAGFLVEHGARHVHRRDLAAEEAFLLRGRDSLLADERELVLRLAR